MKKGFTLIEVLVAAMIGIVICFGASLATVAFIRQHKLIGADIDAMESLRVSVFRIVSETRGANSIRPASGPGILVLELGAKDVSFDIKYGKVRRTVDGSSSYLTEDGRIGGLSFSYPLPGLVKIEIMCNTKKPMALTAEAYVRNYK